MMKTRETSRKPPSGEISDHSLLARFRRGEAKTPLRSSTCAMPNDCVPLRAAGGPMSWVAAWTWKMFCSRRPENDL
jgi:hypothetical protein